MPQQLVDNLVLKWTEVINTAPQSGVVISPTKDWICLAIRLPNEIFCLLPNYAQSQLFYKVPLHPLDFFFGKFCSLYPCSNILRILCPINGLYTDGSKTEHGVGAVFLVLTDDIWTYHWSAKLNDNNAVFQAELTALQEAVKYASHLPNHNTFKIHVDNRASTMASSNSKSTNQTARQIFKILLPNPRIKVS
ncbi:hypothetical protein AVEN_54664-1 [Araneus ventricosus]|uniref:RNase H type-1 domain-containing protein n=1 Tax=Araneus ventricosus TaxID=182803 RepID=A0A4Y2BPC2_ARAVE|nr:hypothetical protein AVEN_54664-1 [Araneus ventricosus]